MLKAEHITKKYGSCNAVDDVSLTLLNDEITVIVGESGSGKSTLARMLAFIERPDEGHIVLDDIDLTLCKAKERKAKRKDVQLVMQDAASSLDPHQTARQILDEPLRLLLKLGKDERRRRITELAALTGFPEDRLKSRAPELSGGQMKRLCIARAIATSPGHIIFDESFSGLDMTLRKQVLTMLKDLHKELSIGFLIITHDLDVAMYMADRIHVMRFGRMVETVERPEGFSDFHEDYSKELVRAALYKRSALE